MQITRHTDERGLYLAVECQGGIVLIDAADEGVLDDEWIIYEMARTNGQKYARKRYETPTVLLHRHIMGSPDGMTVDHRNGDKLNCRRFNLRVCTDAQNQKNRRPKRIAGSGFRGVYPRGKRQLRYSVVVTIERKPKYYGSYSDPIEAAKVRDKIVWEAFGEFANLNFPEDYANNAL